MKWTEFKQEVERQMKEQGDEDPDIWYIDISLLCSDVDEITVCIRESDEAPGATIS